MNQESTITQLKWAIQALALEAHDQINIFPDGVVVTDELLLEFDTRYQASISNYPEYFSEDQRDALFQIHLFIDNIPPEETTIRSEEALVVSTYWKELRVLATIALIEFNWTLEIPPKERSN